MRSSGIIYQYHPTLTKSRHGVGLSRFMATGLIALSLGGIAGPLMPAIRLESRFAIQQFNKLTMQQIDKVTGMEARPLPKAAPVIFNPLKTEDGASIEPASREFGLVIPKIGVNTEVIPAVNPADPGEYLEALKKGVAHASTSYFPDEDGTVYLFSHSTNYDWFVTDLNAVFYLLKNLTEGDLIVVFYKGNQYTYRLREKRVVAPTETSYLFPQKGAKTLILQTCWPPGSTAERLLLFADFVEEQNNIL